MDVGRAERGASGAPYPQSAIAGLIPPGGLMPWPLLLEAVPRAGSYAAEACEPRQVRKEAAVNRIFRVT